MITNEEFESILSDINFIEMLLDVFKKSKDTNGISKKELKQEKDFLVIARTRIKMLKEKIRPELNRIIAFQASAYNYPYYTNPLSFGEELMIYQNNYNIEQLYFDQHEKELESNQNNNGSIIIDNPEVSDETKEKITEHLEYIDKVFKVNSKCNSTQATIIKRLIINYLEGLKLDITPTKSETKKKTLEK